MLLLGENLEAVLELLSTDEVPSLRERREKERETEKRERERETERRVGISGKQKNRWD